MQLAIDDVLARSHHLIDDVFWYVCAAASDIGATVFDRNEIAVRTGHPVAGLDLFDFCDQVLVPDPSGRAERRLRRELAQVAMMSGAVDLALLRHDLHGRRVDVLTNHVDALVDEG